jgi:hypothetical protein
MLPAQAAGNILEIVAKLAPIPYLDTSFSILSALCTSIKHVRGIRAQMTALATTVAELLYHLNIKLQGMDHLDESIQVALHDFNGLLTDICDTAEKYSKRSYLKIFFTPGDIQGLINMHHQKIAQVSSNFQMHLQMTIHNDIRRFEEARQEDHRDVMNAIEGMKKDKDQFAEAANEAMKDDSPLTEKDVKEYFMTSTTDDTTPDERELERDIVGKMLRCLNQRSSLLVAPEYQASRSTGWSPQQYSPSYYSTYSYSEEPGTMADAESQMPSGPNRPYAPRRPVYSPVDGYTPYPYEAHTGLPSPYTPRVLNTYGNDVQPYPLNLTGHGTMEMPTPHHYPTR